jgi:hypothetical protein
MLREKLERDDDSTKSHPALEVRYREINRSNSDIGFRLALTHNRSRAAKLRVTHTARAPLGMEFKELRRHDPARPEGHEDQ